jgi:hypothetical protein
MRDPIVRFMEKVDTYGKIPSQCPKLGRCWNFTSSIGRTGCGRFFYKGKSRDAYRVGYELMVRPLDSREILHHKCQNRKCVRPTHFDITTSKNHFCNLHPNHLAYINSRKTHCPHGHEYTKENLVPSTYGRKCLTCKRIRSRITAKKIRLNKLAHSSIGKADDP